MDDLELAQARQDYKDGLTSVNPDASPQTPVAAQTAPIVTEPTPTVNLESIETKPKQSLIQSILGKSWAFASMYSVTSLNIPSLNVDLANGMDLDITVTNVSINPIQYRPIEEVIGGRWVYTNGMEELKQVDITFRDVSGMQLYTTFRGLQDTLKNQYPDSQKWTISISSMNNRYTPEDIAERPSETLVPVLNTTNAIINSIGSVNFDSASKEVVTFTVSFRYSVG